MSYGDNNLTAGESVPVTLTVINAGDHTVSNIELSLNGTPVKTESVSLLPGQSVEIETDLTCPSALTAYTFAVVETDETDYTPADNEYELILGYADAAVELDYQQIGTSKALVATVTNQGVETASGSVIFYDADGKPVAENTFEGLAAGDVAIASYAVTESFSGVNGGDVSAKIVLELDELYTYNNETTMHILKRAPCRAVVGDLSHRLPRGGCDTAKWFKRGVDPVFGACEETNHRHRTLLKIRTSMTQQDKVRDVKNLRGSN